MLKTRCSLIKGFVYGIFKLKSKVQPFDHIFSAVLLLTVLRISPLRIIHDFWLHIFPASKVIVAVSTQSSLSHRKLPIGYNAFPLPTLSYFVRKIDQITGWGNFGDSNLILALAYVLTLDHYRYFKHLSMLWTSFELFQGTLLFVEFHPIRLNLSMMMYGGDGIGELILNILAWILDPSRQMKSKGLMLRWRTYIEQD
uniref:Uncharacterized protein n=1 Tax=Lactuca sativa TaxID=4236 RepID=A0A9R1VSP4_LACSA|nr:hypothetical protein LSAT_V11C400180560 [Lactuca sativa]